MASIFTKPKKKPNLGRNGFDVSQRRIFSCPPGMLLPTYYDFANPGDKYKLNSRVFVRTEPLESAAFVRIKAHVDWFFVPMTQIYSLWNEFYHMTDDVMSSIYERDSVKSVLPAINHTNLKFSSSSNSGLSYFVKSYSSSPIHVLNVDEFGIPLIWNARRLFDMIFGMPNASNPNMNWYALPLLAYHKCFHSHYRNTDYTKNEPSMYNVDRYYSVADNDPDHFSKLLRIHYRNWRPDLYNAVQPAPTFGNSFASYLPTVSNNALAEFEAEFPESSRRAALGLGNQISSGSSGQSLLYPLRNIGFSMDGSAPFFSVSDIRAAFAMDKLLRITASTGSHYDEQTLAHFGYQIPKGISDEAYYLGEQIADININEVVSTSTSGAKGDDGKAVAGSTIGDIAGKGFGMTSNSKDISFECPDFGFIMAIYSIEPIADYQSDGDITQYYKQSLDFFHPEFDNIGMQPYGYFGSGFSGSFPGWQYRYINHKVKLDIADESIYSTHRSSWAASRSSSHTFLGSNSLYSESMRARFYIFPQYLNGIFLQSVPHYSEPPVSAPAIENKGYASFVDNGSGGFAQGYCSIITPEKIYGTDNFINVLEHKVFKTSVMSVRSLPNM